jgi:SAM-dependent methyltransferase
MSVPIDFENSRFSAPAHVRYATHVCIERLVSTTPGIRSVLEIGCGTATGLGELAARFPHVTFAGVDRSVVAVAAARAHAPNMTVVAGDYVTSELGSHDLLCSESTLQLIDVPDAVLARKLAHDVLPGGKLVCSMPYDCRWNRALMILRRGLGIVRSPLLDRAILALGSRRYPQFARAALEERLAYIYTPVKRFDGPAFRHVMHAAGFDVESWERLPVPSIAKAKHALIIFRKRSES